MYESMLSFPGGLVSQFDRLRRELDDVFGAAGLPSSIRSVAPGSFPPINIGTTDKSVEIYAFAPGLDPAQIDITLDRGVLTLSGERAPELPHEASGASSQTEQQQPPQSQVHVYSRERPTGRFKRAVSLPEDIDPVQVQANYRDGVLQISVARREAAQPQRISVQ